MLAPGAVLREGVWLDRGVRGKLQSVVVRPLGSADVGLRHEANCGLALIDDLRIVVVEGDL